MMTTTRSRTVRALIVLLIGAGSATVATSAGAAEQRPTKPTVVLVHGAWADSSSWSSVVRRLQRHGYTVDVPPNPLRGLISDSSYLASYLQTISGPVVLVGHSYGGAVITNAATGDADVEALVYVDGFAPDTGETVVQLATARPGSAIGGNPATVFDAVPFPGAPAGDVDLYVKKPVFRAAFTNDLPRKTGRVLAAVQRPVAFSALITPSDVPAWRTIPSWYFVGTADNVIPPADARTREGRRGPHVTPPDGLAPRGRDPPDSPGSPDCRLTAHKPGPRPGSRPGPHGRDALPRRSRS